MGPRLISLAIALTIVHCSRRWKLDFLSRLRLFIGMLTSDSDGGGEETPDTLDTWIETKRF